VKSVGDSHVAMAFPEAQFNYSLPGFVAVIVVCGWSMEKMNVWSVSKVPSVQFANRLCY
jgi:hypothetical protein